MGYAAFQAKCASCHTEPLFTDLRYHNNGLPLNSYLKDYGRMRITQLSNDSLTFKTPSLRNVALTFPYMHDGRFYSLNDVFDHYSKGIQYSPALDRSLLYGISISAADRVNLMAFLKTLTDSSFVKKRAFSQP